MSAYREGVMPLASTRCMARLDRPRPWEYCHSPGVVRTDADGQPLGRYCIYHFRRLHPALGPVPTPHARVALSDRQQEARRLRHEERLTLREIGARLGGVTPERVRQIVAVADHKHRNLVWLAERRDEAWFPNWVGEAVPA